VEKNLKKYIIEKIPKIIIETSIKLRKEMTKAEKILWNKLKQLKNIKFVKQMPVYVYTENSWLDRYIIPDFLCREFKLIIELDWSILNLKKIYELDKYKENLLLNLWYTIIRFKNEKIYNNLEKLINKIAASFFLLSRRSQAWDKREIKKRT